MTLALGHKSIAECQEHISAKEFAYWRAYGMLEPYGPRADDRRAGTIAAALVNLYLDKKKRKQPYTWLDFFPAPKIRTEALTPDALLEKIAGINAALGGKDLRKKS